MQPVSLAKQHAGSAGDTGLRPAPELQATARSYFSPSRLGAALSLLPATVVVAAVYIGGTLWAFNISLTSSGMLPAYNYVGVSQYAELLNNFRWGTSVTNLIFYAAVFVPVTLILGYCLAILIDQKIKGESLLRSIYLYPFALSFIVTGLIWRWLLNPTFGIQEIVRGLGFKDFVFDWIVNPRYVMLAIVLAAVWHGTGLVMVIALAGLRGIDGEIWKSLRIEGVPAWRGYVQVVLPMLGANVATATVLLFVGVIRLFDLVVAMTGGGPGTASDVPAKFVIEHLFERQQIALASAAAVVLLVAVMIFIVPWLIWQNRQESGSR